MGWDTAGSSCAGFCGPQNEEGSVDYKVGGGGASLYFNNPASGKNTCDVKILSAGPGDLTGGCEASQGYTSMIEYAFHSLNK